ncbi:hypothetical protein Lal_00011827 [Lupinus albus]|uniref:Putative transcription factor MYB-HB-like family n=1 Tax=Lupinus albus TaxID=3870 RepID=A0A6A4QF51_LUPAL|nr:putative transcription factor MYB-HB-like family [Lupinus albus]KAF1880768.1 hypothetical protein Lal_00011827 [Lupinus albus]
MVRTPCWEKVGLKKGMWTEEEDDILRKYIQENGEGSWRSLSKNAVNHLPGRTDNEIMNYWNSHLSCKIYNFRKQATITDTDLTPKLENPPKPRSCRTSR